MAINLQLSDYVFADINPPADYKGHTRGWLWINLLTGVCWLCSDDSLKWEPASLFGFEIDHIRALQSIMGV
jgi:hypothetical protein